MRIEVDDNACAGHGQCAVAGPDIFRADDEHTADACPERAITISGYRPGAPPAAAGQVPGPMLAGPVAVWHSAGWPGTG